MVSARKNKEVMVKTGSMGMFSVIREFIRIQTLIIRACSMQAECRQAADMLQQRAVTTK